MKRCYCAANRLTGITRGGRSQPKTTNNEVHSQVAATARSDVLEIIPPSFSPLSFVQNCSAVVTYVTYDLVNAFPPPARGVVSLLHLFSVKESRP
ncbi:hypothetical protein Q8A67_005785 [Cirrhinus molitorella]|uniref:Uncharacterized protein n=1 Tax=Cirrhinus molitorella TaxID=172907 RepID=A0AA88Q926_9TELE|nr:hypothetical protein Q8A67_005785 [Cirrhinus molitorella]